ncbi:Protein translocase subunit SecA chloroplastic-like [Heracleum sosnowskyi]|uniref:Protein translocase subunit SecA chloroplastic-like n=1 Tax=Heracleum sosnowskyi TaxID=360622 RepID=A0AAD8HKV1_9APIA|nr:Protein translocase subunit SecA chloroplastic-like [Heracleum sosnowskyi]
MLTKALDEAQRKVKNYFFDIRNQLFEYDEVLNSQRDRVYTERRRALESDNLQPLLWKEYLQALKFVQQTVGLRGYAQRDPLIEYKLDGYNLFIEMMAQIRRNVIYSIYQFKHVMVKEKKQADQSSKLDKNGKGSDSKKPKPVGAGETSS